MENAQQATDLIQLYAYTNVSRHVPRVNVVEPNTHFGPVHWALTISPRCADSRSRGLATGTLNGPLEL
jgi:hypothetical protein